MPASRSALSGQSFVEFGLLLPVLALVLVGTLDLARVFYAKVSLANASRVAAEFAVNPVRLSLNNYDLTAAQTEVKSKAVQEIGALMPITTADVSFNGNFQPGAKFAVTVSTNFSPITPLLASIAGNQMAISHTTELRHNCAADSACDY